MAPRTANAPRTPNPNNIQNVPADCPMYIGADQASGYMKFAGRNDGRTIGYDVRAFPNIVSLGPAATLAMGLTERCARRGRGKIYYFCKLTHEKNRLDFRNLPESYLQLPDLVYVDYKWTQERTQTWLQMPHWQRLDALSARGCTLTTTIPTLPITLCYETDDYIDIRFFEGLGEVVLYYNLKGAMYLGFLDDLSRIAGYNQRAFPLRSQWIAQKTNVQQFQMRSGTQAVDQLRHMYLQQRPGTMCCYGTIIAQSVAAHREWVANGGYTVASDPQLGPKIVQKVAEARRRLMDDVIVQPEDEAQHEEEVQPIEDGARLQALREEVATWSDNEKKVLGDYLTAANTSILAVSRFVARDEGWNSLTVEHKDKMIDIWELEQAVTERV